MKASKPFSGSVGRADLLRLLSYSQADRLSDFSAFLGYEHEEPLIGTRSSETHLNITLSQLEDSAVAAEIPSSATTSFWYVKSYRQNVDAELNRQNEESDSKGDAMSISPKRVSSPLPDALISTGQQNNVLDDVLSDTREHEIDIPASVQLIARRQPIRSWPKKARSTSVHEVTVFVDFAEELYPIHNDFLLVKEAAESVLGRKSVRCVVSRHGPLALEDDFSELQQATNVMILSDAGRYERNASDRTYQWREVIESLQKMGHHGEVFSFLDAIGGDHHAESLLPLRSKNVDALMGILSFCHYPNAGRIRYLRQAIPSATVWEELAVWNHKDAEIDGIRWSVKPDLKPYYQEQFFRLDNNLKNRLLVANRQWQFSLVSYARGLEELVLYDRGIISERPDAEAFASLLESNNIVGSGSHGELFLLNALDTLSSVKSDKERKRLKALFTKAQDVALHYHQPVVSREESKIQNNEESCFYQYQNDSHYELRSGQRPAIFSSKELVVEARSQRFVSNNQRWTRAPVKLQTRNAEVEVDRLQKPNWAERAWRNEDGLSCAHESGAIYQLREASEALPEARWEPISIPWAWSSDTGVDKYGLWTAFTVRNVRQILRWIPPGSFMMGSPEDEPERHDDEIQHQVTLSEGYWLAETACTQGLWEAVMGQNPSEFTKGDDYPVESVSWKDCQLFLEKLDEEVEGLSLFLPSEAQWEYACRGGTDTAFWWGDELSPDQGRYYYEVPYGSGEARASERGTVPVLGYEANPFGLYQMHGNIREWCEDWFGDYPSGAVRDPVGPAKGRYRVLRGGGWISDGLLLRSAFRDYSPPDLRSNDFGFRLAGGMAPDQVVGIVDREGRSPDVSAMARKENG